jgi:hypothetical protein
VLAAVAALAALGPWGQAVDPAPAAALEGRGQSSDQASAASPGLLAPAIVLPLRPASGASSVIARPAPAAAPSAGPELDALLKNAASVDWTVPQERRDLGDGAESLPGSEPRVVVVEGCKNNLVQLLASVGFAGEDLREAWAIAMRETGGRAYVGPGDPSFNGADYGLFQLNRPTYFQQPWWHETALLDGEYNARVAFFLSDGGRTWYPWGLDGRGQTNPVVYDSIWTPEMIYDRITEPYQRFYAQFPC